MTEREPSREELQQALRRAEERYRTLAEHTSEVVMRFDRELRHTFVSPVVAALWPLPAEAYIGKTHRELGMPERLCEQREGWLRRVFETGEPARTEFEFELPGGPSTWEWRLTPEREADGTVRSVVTFARDISDRRRAERSTRRSEQRFRAVMDNAPAALFAHDLEGRIIMVNAAACRYTGYTREELLTLTVHDVDPDAATRDDRARLWHRLGRGESAALESFHRRKDGSSYPVEVRITADTLDGAPILIAFAIDISERRRAEAALLRQQQIITLNNRIAAVFLTAPPGQLYADVLDVVRDALNSRFGYLGYIDEAGDLVCPSMTRGVWSRCQVDDKSIVFPRDSWGGLWGRSLRERRSLRSNRGLSLPAGHIELRCALAVPIVHGDELLGQVVVADRPGGYGAEDQELLEGVAAQVAPILRGQLEGERRQARQRALEQQLQHAQKMESVGRLAGGVAHDFNNLLTTITGNVTLAMMDLSEGDPLRETLGDVERAAASAGALTRQLLAFSRKQLMQPRVLDLNALLEQMNRMLARLIREDIALRVRPAPEPGRINADPGQVEQIIANLAVNARDAMPHGGALTIETAVVEISASDGGADPRLAPGQYVELAVSDTGEGMDGATRSRIFDPFFTTKQEGEGTGLGLATVYGIVRQHGGQIDVSSSPGAGTTFRVYFPRVDAPAEPVERGPGRRELPRGRETVLVVEDEPMVRRIAIRILERQGYRVHHADSGGDALALVERHELALDLLLTDVVMPHMDGVELAGRLRRAQPGLKVLYTSGYTEHAFARDGAPEPGEHFIAKPYSPEALARKVREVLGDQR